MQIRVWRNLPDEVTLNIVARLLPRRSLFRLRTVWKAWNEMLSSYTAIQRIYPNVHLSNNSAFLFQFGRFESWYLRESVKTWMMEGSGDFYKVGEHSYVIHVARNTMFCLHYGNHFYICDEQSRRLKCLPYNGHPTERRVKAFGPSNDHLIMLLGDSFYYSIDTLSVYDSSNHMWNRPDFTIEGEHTSDVRVGEVIRISGRGVYHRGRFYWLNNLSCEGEVVELNLSDSCLVRIPPPHGAIYRNLVYRHGDADADANVHWFLAGSDFGELVLVDREYGFMWKLENGEENKASKRWCRVDICLPRQIILISVNNSGWTVAVWRGGINVYDGSRRLVRKIGMDEIDPELGQKLMKLKDFESEKNSSVIPPLLSFECTYIWWPGDITSSPKFDRFLTSWN